MAETDMARRPRTLDQRREAAGALRCGPVTDMSGIHPSETGGSTSRRISLTTQVGQAETTSPSPGSIVGGGRGTSMSLPVSSTGTFLC